MNSVDALFRNARTAFRVLARAPGFTATVVLTIALGIGAASAVFCAIDVVLLRPLPFPESDRLVRLTQVDAKISQPLIAPARLEDWSRLNSVFESITGYYFEDVSDTTGELPEKIRRANVASRFFEVWRFAPVVGRAFTPEDYKANGSIMISVRYWRARFAAGADVAGKRVRIGSQAYTVIGVVPAAFGAIDRDVDVFAPVVMGPLQIPRSATWYAGYARLKPGVSVAQAQSNLSLVQAQLARQYPDTDSLEVKVESVKDRTVGDVRGSLWLLFGAVSVLLLIACTNIAALVLSRSAQREQEIALRFSLGSSRSAVMAQLLTECAALAFAGALLGVVIAAALSAAFRSLAPDLPRVEEIAINWRVLAFALAAAVAVALLCGLPPAIQSTRGSESLRQAGRTQVSARHSVQWTLVGVQVALSVTLLVGAGLLLRSFERLLNVERGFNPQHVLSFQVSGGWAETANREALVQRINSTIDALASLPGARSVATSSQLPGVPGQLQVQVSIQEGQRDSTTPIAAESRTVSPSYFEVLQIPLLGGELCRRPATSIVGDVSPAAMVNRTFVTRYVGNRSPLGLHLSGVFGLPSLRIVGVVGDARETGINREPPPVVYLCFSAPTPTPTFLVRTSGDPMLLANAIRLKVRELTPLRSVYDIAPLEERIGDAFSQNRLRAILLGSFAAAALALACLGIYGTLSYIVTLRQREIGLWLALGAMRAHVVGRFLRKTLLVVGGACLAGVAISLALAKVISGMLFGVAAADPVTFSAVVATVMLVGTLAALFPSVRAAMLDPMLTLREE